MPKRLAKDNDAARDLWKQIFTRQAADEYSALVDPDYDPTEDEKRAAEALRKAGWSDKEIEVRAEGYRSLLAHVPTTSPGVNPFVELQLAQICDHIEAVMDHLGLTSHAKVARGVEPRACAFATKTGVVMTDQSVVTVSAFLFRFCGLIGRAFLRTIRLDPFGWDHNEFDLDRSIRIVRSNPELLLYWFKIYFSFATTGTHVLVPFEPATPSEIAAFEDIAWVMEYFAVAHEYGHHHHSHGKDLSSDAHREEFEADQFALRIGTKLARYQRRIENPYVASGAGGIIILWALHTLKSFPAAGSSVSNEKLDTHPNLKERLGRFESVAVLQPSEFERLRRFRMAALRLMSVIHGQMCEAMDAVPSDLLKNLSCASQWT